MSSLPTTLDEPIRAVDHQLLEVLRSAASGATVTSLAEALNVTATAVRQRIDRMLEAGLIERRKVAAGRGRPTFTYALTVQGHRQAGADYAALAEAMWQEILSLPEGRWRRKLLRRIALRLGREYAAQLPADRPLVERFQELSQLMAQRRIPAGVLEHGSLPVLDVHVCPYPDLASGDQRREMCHLEEEMLSEALGQPVHLSRCRMDGDSCCQFIPTAPTEAVVSVEDED